LGNLWPLPLHRRPARPRPGRPHLRRDPHQQLPAHAGRLRRIRLHTGALAGLFQGRPHRRRARLPTPRTPLRPHQRTTHPSRPTPPSPRPMTKRIFSTVLLWLIILGAMYFFQARGGIVLMVLVSTLTLREFYQMVARMGHAPFARIGLLLGAAITIAPVLEPRFPLVTPENLLALAAVVFAIRIEIGRAHV